MTNVTAQSVGLFAPDEVFTDKEVAAATKTERRSWQNLRSLGRGPKYIKFGRSARYLGRDLNDYFRIVETAASKSASVAQGARK